MTTCAAPEDKSPRIQGVGSRLKKMGDGRPRLFLLRDALVARDPLLMDAADTLGNHLRHLPLAEAHLRLAPGNRLENDASG
jgi:hypothetical protein